MTRRILIVISEWGYWGEEVIGPLQACDEAGYDVEFLTPTGDRPTALAVSADPAFVDAPLGRPVTTPEMAKATRVLADSNRLDHPRSLADWYPLRPYPSSATYLSDMETYYQQVDHIASTELPDYDALVIAGGSGAMVDLANNSRLHQLVLGFVGLDKPVAAECYGVAALAFARDLREKRSIIAGRRVTGHPLDYDYLAGTGFEGPHGVGGSRLGFGEGYIDFGPPFYPLEHILRDAVGEQGQFIGNVGHRISVIVDYPFITSRSTAGSIECGQALVQVLEHGMRRLGW